MIAEGCAVPNNGSGLISILFDPGPDLEAGLAGIHLKDGLKKKQIGVDPIHRA